MENNFEMEEMKQQWQTLQAALNSQKEVNIKLVLNDAKKRVSWSNSKLRGLFILLLAALPVYIFLLPKYGVPQPIYLALILFIIVYALNILYMSFILKTPNDGNIDIVKYGKSLVRLKKRYILSETIGTFALLILVVWAVITMGFDITHPIVMGMTIAAPIGIIAGVTLAIRFLKNIKELQSDIDLIEGLKD